jgi:hypothetical protein
VQRVIENQARYGYLREGVSGVPVLELELPQGKRALPEDY